VKDDPLAIEVPWIPDEPKKVTKEIGDHLTGIKSKAIKLEVFQRESSISDMLYATRLDLVSNIKYTLKEAVMSDVKDKYRDLPLSTLDVVLSTYDVTFDEEHDCSRLQRTIIATARPRKEVLICTVPIADSVVGEKSKEWGDFYREL
jgi:glycerol-3-phosphate cytidylyltransferase-like family protein